MPTHKHDPNTPETTMNHTGSEPPEARFDLIPPESYERLALIYTEGAAKYGDNSWRRFQNDDKFIKSRISHAEVHWNKWKKGDRSVDHLAKVAWAAFTLMQCQDIKLTEWEENPNTEPEPPLFRQFTGKVFQNTYHRTLTFDDGEIVTVVPVYEASLPPADLWQTHNRWRVTLKEDAVLGIVFEKAERLEEPAKDPNPQGNPELGELKNHTKPPSTERRDCIPLNPQHNEVVKVGTFAWAMHMLNQGARIRRKSWFGTEQWSSKQNSSYVCAPSDVRAEDWELLA